MAKNTMAISKADIERRRDVGEPLSSAQKRYVRCIERGDRDECAYCGAPLNDRNRTIDHRQSVLRGGGNEMGNICLACHDCNERKSAMSVTEFMAYLRLAKEQAKPPRSLGVKSPQRPTVPITSLLSDESQRALNSLKLSSS